MKYIALHSSILLKPVKFMISKNVDSLLLAYTITLKFHFVLGLKHGVVTLFTIKSISPV